MLPHGNINTARRYPLRASRSELRGLAIRTRGSANEDILLKNDGDLPEISTRKGKELAHALRRVLEEIEFDSVNRELQRELFGGNYVHAPYPLFDSEIDYATIRAGLEFFVRNSGSKITLRQKLGFEFLMFSENLTREHLEILLGEKSSRPIDDFLDVGLFVETGSNRIRMNGLALLSKRLGREEDGAAVYIFADSRFRDHPDQNKFERVYAGLDSYELVNKLNDLVGLSGIGIDMGSGSGIQLIAALKLFPAVKKMVGYEKDRRAINVSKFNAFLNGVGDRATIVENEKELAAALGDDLVDFALSNPPFMPVPDAINVDRDDAEILSKAKAISIIGEKSAQQVSLRNMWPRSGWGGLDGVSILKPMLDILFPIIGPSGKIIVYAEFAGNRTGPTKILEFIESHEGWEHSWEPLKPSFYYMGSRRQPVLPSLPAQFMAVDVMGHILGGYPELSQPPYSDILLGYADEILDMYQGLGITHFHKGFLTLKKGKETSDNY